jgi:hypothetical protein
MSFAAGPLSGTLGGADCCVAASQISEPGEQALLGRLTDQSGLAPSSITADRSRCFKGHPLVCRGNSPSVAGECSIGKVRKRQGRYACKPSTKRSARYRMRNCVKERYLESCIAEGSHSPLVEDEAELTPYSVDERHRNTSVDNAAARPTA